MKIAHMKAVAHDIAHHAGSSFSPLTGTLYRVCREVGVVSVTLDLRSSAAYPSELPANAELERDLGFLRETFHRILADRGFEPGILTMAQLRVDFPPMETDVCLVGTHAVIEAAGRRFERGFPLPGPEYLAWLRRQTPYTLFHVLPREEVLEEMRLYEAALEKDRAV